MKSRVRTILHTGIANLRSIGCYLFALATGCAKIRWNISDWPTQLPHLPTTYRAHISGLGHSVTHKSWHLHNSSVLFVAMSHTRCHGSQISLFILLFDINQLYWNYKIISNIILECPVKHFSIIVLVTNWVSCCFLQYCKSKCVDR